MKITPDEELLDLEQLGEWLGLPKRTIYNWRQRGIGPQAYKLGKHLRYRRGDVEAWLETQHDDQRIAG